VRDRLARDDHAVSVVDARGREIRRCTAGHSAAGLRALVSVLASAGAGEAAIERPDGPVIDALPGAGVTVGGDQPEPGQETCAALRPGREQGRPVRRVRPGRHPAYRLRPAAPADPDTPPTVSLRRACRAGKDLISHRVAVANQLRAHLSRAFPGAVGLFADIDPPVSLKFPARFDTQDRAD
jgi:hypothetical protein